MARNAGLCDRPLKRQVDHGYRCILHSRNRSAVGEYADNDHDREINRKRQEGDLVSYFVFTPQKPRMIVRESRRPCPDGQLHIYAHLALVAHSPFREALPVYDFFHVEAHYLSSWET